MLLPKMEVVFQKVGLSSSPLSAPILTVPVVPAAVWPVAASCQPIVTPPLKVSAMAFTSSSVRFRQLVGKAGSAISMLVVLLEGRMVSLPLPMTEVVPVLKSTSLPSRKISLPPATLT